MWQSHVPLQPSSIALKGTKKAGRCNRMHLPASFVLPDFLPSYWLILASSEVVLVHASVYSDRSTAGKCLAVIFIPFLQGMNRVGMEPYSEK